MENKPQLLLGSVRASDGNRLDWTGLQYLSAYMGCWIWGQSQFTEHIGISESQAVYRLGQSGPQNPSVHLKAMLGYTATPANAAGTGGRPALARLQSLWQMLRLLASHPRLAYWFVQIQGLVVGLCWNLRNSQPGLLLPSTGEHENWY